MIIQRAYPVEPWHVRETSLNLDLLAQSESVFALSNGHIGLRGNLDEGEPHGMPARLVGQSELVANETVPAKPGDPRSSANLKAPLEAEQHLSNATGGLLVHRTKLSGLRMAAAMDHLVTGPDGLRI